MVWAPAWISMVLWRRVVRTNFLMSHPLWSSIQRLTASPPTSTPPPVKDRWVMLDLLAVEAVAKTDPGAVAAAHLALAGAIVGALIGAGAAIVAALITNWRARRDAQADRRRGAYSAFLESQEELYRRMKTPAALDSEVRRTTVGEAIGSGIGSVSSAYTAVRLTGSKDAVAKARVCQEETWKIYNLFFPDGKQVSLSARDLLGQVENLLPSYQEAAKEFLDVARKDVGSKLP